MKAGSKTLFTGHKVESLMPALPQMFVSFASQPQFSTTAFNKLPSAFWLQAFSFTFLLMMMPGPIQGQAPEFTDYCDRLQQEIQGRKHGFLAGNLTYYVGGFHASWNLQEHETIGLTHPFHHDLRSRGVGLVESQGQGAQDTGIGNDFSGWEFYKDTRVLYGSVLIGDQVYAYPQPTSMRWRPDRMICEYEVGGVKISEEKFISQGDVAISRIQSSEPIVLRFDGQSFYGRHSISSSAEIEYREDTNAIHIREGGTTRCLPETDRSPQVGPIMYQDMSTVLTASRGFADQYELTRGPKGQWKYQFSVPCDENGLTVAWAMNDDKEVAIETACAAVQNSSLLLSQKTTEVNRLLNEEIPWFRCSDQQFEDIYYYLWSLYLLYYIDVQRGWETVPHTQTAVNNFLGMHRYDATFQIKVGAWLADKPKYAFGNVLTWKPLFTEGFYRETTDGVIALSDNKGQAWHSGVYGNELSEHVVGAWQVYQQSGSLSFLHECYEGYFREVFWGNISPFFSNQFEVVEILKAMAQLTGNSDDLDHWDQLVSLDAKDIEHWFSQRWEANGHKNYFAGPKNGMLMTTGFWHLRSKHFPQTYAQQMTQSWALNSEVGFQGIMFPLAMAKQSATEFNTRVDDAFGYTPDTAYFTLSGLFQQRLATIASDLTLNHLQKYNYHSEWQIPVAPEAYRRDGSLFGDQYSNFNAGKILLFLEGLAGLEYSIPQNKIWIRDAMPTSWDWMEFRIPVRNPNADTTSWPSIRYERKHDDDVVTKTIAVKHSPFDVVFEPWTENGTLLDAKALAGRLKGTETDTSVPFTFPFDRSNSPKVLRVRYLEPTKN